MRKKDIEKYMNFTSNVEIQNSLLNWNLVNKYATIFILVLYLLSGCIQTLKKPLLWLFIYYLNGMTQVFLPYTDRSLAFLILRILGGVLFLLYTSCSITWWHEILYFTYIVYPKALCLIISYYGTTDGRILDIWLPWCYKSLGIS